MVLFWSKTKKIRFHAFYLHCIVSFWYLNHLRLGSFCLCILCVVGKMGCPGLSLDIFVSRCCWSSICRRTYRRRIGFICRYESGLIVFCWTERLKLVLGFYLFPSSKSVQIDKWTRSWEKTQLEDLCLHFCRLESLQLW